MPNSIFVENTPYAIGISIGIVALLAWRLKPSVFRLMAWQSFGVASALFWGVFAALIVSFGWNFYYKLFVPDWYRFTAPIGAVVLYSAIAILFRWITLRLPGNPVIWFCMLGGIESIPEHTVGIYRFHILEIPILAGSSAASLFIFAFFEYVIYWGLVLALAIGVERAIKVTRRSSLKEQAPSNKVNRSGT